MAWEIGAYVAAHVDVDATLGTVDVAPLGATVSANTSFTATAGALTVAAFATALNVATAITATAGAVVVAGYAPSINAATTISASAGTVAVTSYGATVTNEATEVQIDCTLGALAVAGYGATINSGVIISVSGGGDGLWDIGAYIFPSASTNAVTISGNAATVQTTTGVNATAGALTIAALGTAVSAATTVAATAGTVAVADYNASVRQQVEGQFNMFYDLADHLGQQLHNFGGDTFKVGLIDGSIVPAQTSAAAWGTFSSSEVSGTGYSAGGVALSGASFNEASGTATFDATDTTFSYNAAGPEDARYAILYNDSDATTPKAAIGWLDLGTEVSLRDGDLVLQWAGDGIHQIAPV